MSGTVAKWLSKAEDDFQLAAMIMRARKHRSPDGVCFHVQQCIEKLMKAVLVRKKIVPPKTHDLVDLSNSVGKAVRGWHFDEEQLRFLNTGAVLLRYPDASATLDDAKRAMRICRKLREELLPLV